MDELKAKLDKHRYHIKKLETLLRMLDNMSVEVDTVSIVVYKYFKLLNSASREFSLEIYLHSITLSYRINENVDLSLFFSNWYEIFWTLSLKFIGKSFQNFSETTLIHYFWVRGTRSYFQGSCRALNEKKKKNNLNTLKYINL